MPGREQEAWDWRLAVLTALVWGSMYALYFLHGPDGRRRLELLIWRARNRLRFGRRRPRPVPPRLLRPTAPVPAVSRIPRVPPAIAAGRASAARAVAVAEPIRIAEWRVDNLPLRYRLLGRVRRGANDN